MGNASWSALGRRTLYFAPAAKCRAAIHFTFMALVILLLQAAALMAQTGGGATLVGTVKDSSGAVVAGAKITVVNTATLFVAGTTTQTDGGYYVPYLIPGNYKITVNAPGFKEFVRDGLACGQRKCRAWISNSSWAPSTRASR
jgi:hypothetical protein